MKKLLLSAVAVGLMSISAFAFDGTVGDVIFASNGNIVVPIVGESETKTYLLVTDTADVRKTQIAALLTAKANTSQVSVFPETINGIFGWGKVIIK